MQQEVVLAMLAKEPSHGYQLRARLQEKAVSNHLNEAVALVQQLHCSGQPSLHPCQESPVRAVPQAAQE